MSIDFSKPAATSITVHPQPEEAPARPVPNFQKATREIEGEGFWGADGFGFDDFIDLINPLQHIPVVSTVYRAITGDEIAPGPRMIGGALLGGVAGAVASAANIMVEQATGSDIGENVIAAFSDSPAVPVASAAARPETNPHLYTLPHTSVRQAPSLDSEKKEEEENAALEALDFSAVETSAEQAQWSEEDEAILQLFSSQTTQVYEQYQQAQANEYLLQVAKDMKA